MTSENKIPNMPVIKFRAGAISATVWQNTGQNKEGQKTEYRTISLERGYKDKSGAWKSTNSFRINDLHRAALVLNEAYKHLVLKQHQKGSTETVEIDIDEEDVLL